MKKIYPSSVAPVYGNTTNSYNSSCPRFFGMKDALDNIQINIDPLYQSTGRLTEEKILNDLKKIKVPAEELLIETPVKYEISPGWQISGRIDFLLRNRIDPSKSVVWEVKSTVSKSRYNSVIVKGEVNPNQIGQLLTYMMITNIPNGVYSYSFLHFNSDFTSLKFKTKNFKVSIKDTDIYIDGKLWDKFNMHSFTSFYKLMIDARDKKELPAQTINPWACKSCPFSKVCAKEPQSKQEFLDTLDRVGEFHSEARTAPSISMLKEK